MVKGEDKQRRAFELLQDSVREELVVQNGAGRLGLSGEVLDRLAQQIAVTIDYAFDVEWSPDWVKDGDLHRWSVDGQWFARCPECLTDTPPSQSAQAADGWVAEHRRRDHLA